MEIKSYKKGDLIFSEGEHSSAMYILLEGEVEIYIVTSTHEKKLSNMKQNSFFGEMSLFRGKPRSANARAVIDAKVAIIDSKQKLEQFIIERPVFAAKMVGIMAERLAHTNELLVETTNELNNLKHEIDLL